MGQDSIPDAPADAQPPKGTQPDWRLRTLLLKKIPKAAEMLLDVGSLYADFFDHIVDVLMRAPLVPPEGVQHDTKGLPAGEKTEQHHRCVFLAAFGLLRTVTRSGLFAFSCLPAEAIAVHRRTLEAVLDLEFLLDRPDLAAAYEAHAIEGDRITRKNNPFNVAKGRVQSEIKNPDKRFPVAKLSTLQRALRDRADFGMLDAGPHAGPIHAVLGHHEGGFGFIDPRSWMCVRMAFRCGWEAFQLIDALRPKLTWIATSRWEASATSVQAQARVIEQHVREKDKPHASKPAWSSFHPLPSRRPPP